jgi:hypothetical protein
VRFELARKILFIGLLATNSSTGLLAGENTLEVLRSNGPDAGPPDAGPIAMRVQVQLVWDGVAGMLERTEGLAPVKVSDNGAMSRMASSR